MDDIHEVMKKVKAGGGRFLPAVQGGEVDEAPGIGLFATFIDTEGNVVSLYENRGAYVEVTAGSTGSGHQSVQ